MTNEQVTNSSAARSRTGRRVANRRRRPPGRFDRRFLIRVCRDGTVTYTDSGTREPAFNGAALPVCSVDTVQQAVAVQVQFCRRMYSEHPDMPGKPWFRISKLPDGKDIVEREDKCLTPDDLGPIGLMFEALHYSKETAK